MKNKKQLEDLVNCYMRNRDYEMMVTGWNPS